MNTSEFHEIILENLALAKQHNFYLYEDLCDAYESDDLDSMLMITEELSDLLAHRNNGSASFC